MQKTCVCQSVSPSVSPDQQELTTQNPNTADQFITMWPGSNNNKATAEGSLDWNIVSKKTGRDKCQKRSEERNRGSPSLPRTVETGSDNEGSYSSDQDEDLRSSSMSPLLLAIINNANGSPQLTGGGGGVVTAKTQPNPQHQPLVTPPIQTNCSFAMKLDNIRDKVRPYYISLLSVLYTNKNAFRASS